MLTFLSQFDIVDLSETWSDYIGEFNDLLQQYCCFDEVRNKTGSSFRNSGGNCVFVKRKFTDSLVITRLYENVCNYVTLRIDKSFLKDLYDIILVFVYISPEGSSIYNDNDLNGIELLENHLNTVKLDFPDCLLFIAGDFNARTKDYLDFVPDDNLRHIFGNVSYNGDDFSMHRNNKDTKHNNYGTSLTDLCCLLDVHIVNGRLFNDLEGNYTCTAGNGASVVDYIIISSDLFSFVKAFSILDRDDSDHFPINCKLSLTLSENYNLSYDEIEHINIQDQSHKYYRWDDSKAIRFVDLVSECS